MMARNPSWWSMHLHPPSQTNPFPQYVLGSSTTNSLPDELPQPWSQLLLSGEEERFQLLRVPVVEVKQEVTQQHHHSNNNLYGHDEEFQAHAANWSQFMAVSSSSPMSCITSSSSNMLDFSNNKVVAHGSNSITQPTLDHSYECNSRGSTGGVWKKARAEPCSRQPPLKVRKEKLGDRITALHQIVSPFGKTDTASVLLEAIGYIRFLQAQIEALSSPYLGTTSPNMRNQHYVQGERNISAFPEDQQEKQEHKLKDLRSRGLCLVRVSCTQHVGSDNGADYRAPAFGDGFN